MYKMKRFLTLLSSIVLIILLCSSCEKACICTNLNNGASEMLWGVYSKKECEDYTDYYKSTTKNDNIDCAYKIKK